MDGLDLTQIVIIVALVAAAIVIIIALRTGRGVKLSWGDKSAETNVDDGVEQTVTASGTGSSASDIKMSADGSRKTRMTARADKGGTVEGVDLKAAKDSPDTPQ